MEKIKVLLADDHTIVRQGIKALLESEPDIEVVAEAGNGREAVRAAERFYPNVAVIDIAMPLLNGLEATRQILKASPKTKVVLLSMYDHEEYAREAVRAGASGYVLKEDVVEELLAAIHHVCQGEYHFAPSILKIIVSTKSFPKKGREGYESLTMREREVLQLIAEGHTNTEIAEILCRSVHTIRNHRAKIMKKLGLHDVADLVKFALQKGIIPSN